MTDGAKVETYAVRQRRAARRQEWSEQVRLAEELPKYLPAGAFFSALENRPLSPLAGLLQRRRGVRAGLPDLHILYCGKSIYVEMKSHRGLASPAQKQVRVELLQGGAEWWMARTWRAALMALHLSGVPLRPPWKPQPLERWEGPFDLADPHQRLPQAPEVAAQRRAAQRRWRERQRARKAGLPAPDSLWIGASTRSY